MESPSHAKADLSKQISLRKVMNWYGVLLFLGLLISIHAHEIKDVSGFLLFILISSVLYFLMLNLYFENEPGRKIVFIMLCFIALFSLFMVFYTAT